jgi:hypothetical protein
MAASYEWGSIDWERFDFDDCEDEREVYLRKWRVWHRRQTRTPEWATYVKEMRAIRCHRCARCGRVGGRLTVHHREYRHPNLNLWEYDDHEVEVHVGRCHQHADRQREKECRERTSDAATRPEDRIYFPPNDEEAMKLAQYAPLFQQWILENYQVEPTETWPLWYHWNVHGKKFLKTLPPSPQQLKLI